MFWWCSIPRWSWTRMVAIVCQLVIYKEVVSSNCMDTCCSIKLHSLMLRISVICVVLTHQKIQPCQSWVPIVWWLHEHHEKVPNIHHGVTICVVLPIKNGLHIVCTGLIKQKGFHGWNVQGLLQPGLWPDFRQYLVPPPHMTLYM